MPLAICAEEPEMLDETSPIESRESAPAAMPSGQSDWTRLVAKIQRGDADALTELYQVFARGVKFYMYRQLGPQDLDDRLHDVFLVVVQAVQRGELRDPARLMGFVRTIVRRQVATRIDEIVQTRREEVAIDHGPVLADRTQTPEQQAMKQQQMQLIAKVLSGLNGRDRDILTRFYLQEQSQEQICAEMNLTDTQYRLLKSRAKARFGDLGRRFLGVDR
jgi:RNA polymerase sigma-70 factor, ECF subfamily